MGTKQPSLTARLLGIGMEYRKDQERKSLRDRVADSLLKWEDSYNQSHGFVEIGSDAFESLVDHVVDMIEHRIGEMYK